MSACTITPGYQQRVATVLSLSHARLLHINSLRCIPVPVHCKRCLHLIPEIPLSATCISLQKEGFGHIKYLGNGVTMVNGKLPLSCSAQSKGGYTPCGRAQESHVCISEHKQTYITVYQILMQVSVSRRHGMPWPTSGPTKGRHGPRMPFAHNLLEKKT